MHKLITIPFSHYNEKARWALDYFGVEFEESKYMPVLHMPAVWWATKYAEDAGADRVSSRFSTPVLVCEDGQRICDSGRILHYLEERREQSIASLYPEVQCERIEADLHDNLGPHTRRLVYYYILDNRKVMMQVAQKSVGKGQELLFAAAMPMGRALMKRKLKINEAQAMRSQKKIEEAMGAMSEILSDGRPFLVGDRFTAADMALACMAAPALLVAQEEGFGAYFPPMELCPAPLQQFAGQMRGTLAGKHALAMFAGYR